MRGAAKHRVAPTRVACMLDLFLRAKTPARHGDRGFATRTIVPVFKRNKKPGPGSVHVSIEHRFAFGAGHRDGVALLGIQFVTGVLDVIQRNKFAFFINTRG